MPHVNFFNACVNALIIHH